MARVAEAALCHFESAYNHIRFVRARNADDVAGMRAAIASEKDAVRRLLALRARDSRLGYEASNHYFYTVNDLIEKCLQLDWLEGRWRSKRMANEANKDFNAMLREARDMLGSRS